MSTDEVLIFDFFQDKKSKAPAVAGAWLMGGELLFFADFARDNERAGQFFAGNIEYPDFIRRITVIHVPTS